MPKIQINGNKELSGIINISGAKNSAVGLIPTALLCSGVSTIYNVPKISDIKYLIEILELLGCKVNLENNVLKIDTISLENKKIPEELSVQMRASYYFMGALLAKFKKVEISFPGGCKIGSRPIDLHIKGFEALGAKVSQNKNHYIIEAKELKGAKIYLDFPSVGATINIMLASVLAEGTTIIENAAKEPEIVNIASFLINMGAKISGAGTGQIVIRGVKQLQPSVVEVFPDRIEAGTYLIAGALVGKDLIIRGIIKEHIETLLIKLKEAGAYLEIKDSEIKISKIKSVIPTNIITLGYPGFPTDLQQPFTTLLTQSNGTSYIEETIYESRFKNIEYLNQMGADIKLIKNNKIEIKGKTPLYGKNVVASDLRAGASLVLAGLVSEGVTIIDNIDFILRGYEDIIEKLSKVGAIIKIVE